MEEEKCPYDVCDGSGWYESCLEPDNCHRLKCICLEETEQELAAETYRENESFNN